jgi:hypothetical protein
MRGMSKLLRRLWSASFVLALFALSGPQTLGLGVRTAFAQSPSSGQSPSSEQSPSPAPTRTPDKGTTDEGTGLSLTDDEAQRKAMAQRKADEEAQHKTEGTKPKVDEDDGEAPRAVFFAADVAFTRSDLGMIVDDLSFDQTGANGTMYGVTGGYRTKSLRLGLRWRVYDTTEFDLWSFAVSVGYALPMRPITPIFSAHLGYVFDQRIERPIFKSSLPEGNIIPPNVDVKGVMLGIDANAAYWVTSFLRFGPFLGADLMVLHRAQAPLPQSLFGPTPDVNRLPLYTESGASLGLNLNIGIRGAFDVGLR